MSELYTIVADDRLAADARLMELTDSFPPGQERRIHRRDSFSIAHFDIVDSDDSIDGKSSSAERNDGSSVYVIVVEFT